MWSTSSPTPTPNLTAEEQSALARLERQVEAGIASTEAVIQAGRALAAIKDRQLYRSSSPTWEAYVTSRFQITKRRADQLVAFSSFQDTLQEMGTSGSHFSERASRPLVGLPPDQIAEAVAEAACDPAGITPATIRKAAAKRRKAGKAKAYRPRRFKVPGAVVVVTFNRRSNGSVLEALAAAQRQAEEQIEAESRQAEAA